ncbi:hypothetical protein [Candidatus Cardinium hertigii]|jgi:hypothetical protein|uniref:NADPH-dependent FMN reductase-like domain-containing protein n=1 Tax=Candidatus Cardinium hertigii TaxID=247481 RepID=A0A3N2QAZ4_9BACT|nr:hypothetical protein [Candidatus Cardinium hertigii]ROT46973.1 hypothetical protein EDM02_05360 [Candidatus Cardinium hertigii]
MQKNILILTTTEAGNKFPENFSCWCAGALEAKGCNTEVEIIKLAQLTDPEPIQLLELEKEKLNSLQINLKSIEKLVLILPECNNMLPSGIDSLMQLLAVRKQYKTCKLIAIVMDPSTNKDGDDQNHTLFGYPLDKLDLFFGKTLRVNRTQIKNSPSGDMCNLFSECYNDLCTLIQQIID